MEEVERERDEAMEQAKRPAGGNQSSATDEEVSGLEQELHRKNNLLQEAIGNSARLELDLKYAREKLALEKGQGERVLKGLAALAEALGVEPPTPTHRSRRTSGERESAAAAEALEAVVTEARRVVAQRASLSLELEEANRQLASFDAAPRISLSGFEEGHVALFMPLGPEPGRYMAFNRECPRYYLHPESLDLFRADDAAKAESYCLGRISCCYAAKETDNEDYGMPPGESFSICLAEPLV